jgi:hypothetical protein
LPEDQTRAPRNTRNLFEARAQLAPRGKARGLIEISPALGDDVVQLLPQNHKVNSAEINRLKPKRLTDSGTVEETLRGVLRAVNLDKDWIEVVSDFGTHHINGLAEALDDVIGPMVNRRVVVKVRRDASLKYKFEDIELDE